MARKYTVHINGRPLVITARPDPRSIPDNCLSMQVHDDSELVLLAQELEKGRLKAALAFSDNVEALWEKFRTSYRFVQAAGGAVSDEHGRLLAIHRLGVWDLPKGKVEKGESIEEGAVREVEEECGLHNVELIAPLTETWHTYERKGEQHLKRTDWFLMRARSDQPLIAQHEEDISEVRWMDAEGLAEMKRDTYPSLLAVISAWEEARRDPE